MILLAADTSGKEGSLALANASDQEFQMLEIVALKDGNFSAQLVPQIAALLSQHNIAHRDLGGFAVAVGPGSFTGLRVGLAAIKGLAEALNIPIAPVSRLEAVARASEAQGHVIAALDAGRSQAFVGEYQLNGTAAIYVQEQLLSREELATLSQGKSVITPDKNVAEALRNLEIPVLEIVNPRADSIARIGWQKLIAGEKADVATLEANYIRRTDAEILVHGK